jgi:hypothetical protein
VRHRTDQDEQSGRVELVMLSRDEVTDDDARPRLVTEHDDLRLPHTRR